jgi:hypothetical protein
MTIATYDNLKSAIGNWTHRSESDDRVAEFIALAEAKINRRLRVRQMETALAATTLSSALITRPTDLVAFKALWSTTDGTPAVEQKSLEFVLGNSSDGSIPQFYAWDRDYLRFNTDSGEVQGVYYASVPALTTSNTTNWLLTAHPDLYLMTSLAEFGRYSGHKSGPQWIAESMALMEELNGQDNKDRFSGNSLTVRVG